MEGLRSIILGVAVLIALFPAALVTYINVGGSYRALQRFLGAKNTIKREKTSLSYSCSIDSDCPQGHICIDERCMPSQT